MKRTLIPPQLRPNVPGADVRKIETSDLNSGRLIFSRDALKEIDIIVVGSCGDGTSKYFLQRCRAMCHAKFVALEEPLAIALLINELANASQSPGVYFRSCGSSDSDVIQSQQVLSDFLQGYRGRVLHRSVNRSRNYSKPWQLTSIPGSSGLIRVPQTRIGSNHVMASDFPAQIAKSLSAIRSTVTGLDERCAKDGLGMTQELLLGQNVRVHCLQQTIFAWEVQSQSVDYRVDKETALRPIQLPTMIQDWCVEATKEEGLDFSGIDLMCAGDEWFCFEINPTPGYHYYESRLNPPGITPITDALVSWLRHEASTKT